MPATKEQIEAWAEDIALSATNHSAELYHKLSVAVKAIDRDVTSYDVKVWLDMSLRGESIWGRFDTSTVEYRAFVAIYHLISNLAIAVEAKRESAAAGAREKVRRVACGRVYEMLHDPGEKQVLDNELQKLVDLTCTQINPEDFDNVRKAYSLGRYPDKVTDPTDQALAGLRMAAYNFNVPNSSTSYRQLIASLMKQQPTQSTTVTTTQEPNAMLNVSVTTKTFVSAPGVDNVDVASLSPTQLADTLNKIHAEIERVQNLPIKPKAVVEYLGNLHDGVDKIVAAADAAFEAKS